MLRSKINQNRYKEKNFNTKKKKKKNVAYLSINKENSYIRTILKIKGA